MTLRLTDARTGTVTEVPGAGRRLWLHVYGGDDVPAHPDALRLLVTADVLRRLAELAGARVALGRDPAYAAFDGAAADLNIKPADHDGVRYADGARADVLVGPPGAEPPATASLWLAPAPTSGEAPSGDDPLAFRLAALSTHHSRPLALTPAALATASGRLARWRGLVAAWAESPSAPAHRPTVDRVLSAVADDLDTGSALAALDDLADDDAVPPGARFETFAYADRTLALDLVRDVGRPPQSPNSR